MHPSCGFRQTTFRFHLTPVEMRTSSGRFLCGVTTALHLYNTSSGGRVQCLFFAALSSSRSREPSSRFRKRDVPKCHRESRNATILVQASSHRRRCNDTCASRLDRRSRAGCQRSRGRREKTPDGIRVVLVRPDQRVCGRLRKKRITDRLASGHAEPVVRITISGGKTARSGGRRPPHGVAPGASRLARRPGSRQSRHHSWTMVPMSQSPYPLGVPRPASQGPRSGPAGISSGGIASPHAVSGRSDHRRRPAPTPPPWAGARALPGTPRARRSTRRSLPSSRPRQAGAGNRSPDASTRAAPERGRNRRRARIRGW